MINNFFKSLPQTIVIFLLSFLSVFGKNAVLSDNFILIGLLPGILLGFAIIYDFMLNKKFNLQIFLWLLFGFAVLLSELQNGNVSDSLFLITASFVVIYLNKPLEEMVRSLMYGTLPLVFAALIATLLNDKFTSNTIGIIVSSFIISYNILQLYCKKLNIARVLSIIGVNAIVLYIMLFINSRTSLLIIVMCYVLIALHLIYSYRKKIKHLVFQSKYKYVYQILLIITLILLLALVYVMIGKILTPKWRPDDISTGRFDIWLTTIEHSTLFGHAHDWYVTSGLFDTHKGPHNMFIGILGFNGAIALFVFLFFLTIQIFESIKHYVFKPSVDKIVIVILLLTSLTKGLTESLIVQPFHQIYNFFFIYSISYGFINSMGKQKIKVYPKWVLRFSYVWMISFILIGVFGSAFGFSFDQIFSFISKFA